MSCCLTPKRTKEFFTLQLTGIMQNRNKFCQIFSFSCSLFCQQGLIVNHLLLAMNKVNLFKSPSLILSLYIHSQRFKHYLLWYSFVKQNVNSTDDWWLTWLVRESKTESKVNLRSPSNNVSDETFLTKWLPPFSWPFDGLTLTATYQIWILIS